MGESANYTDIEYQSLANQLYLFGNNCDRLHFLFLFILFTLTPCLNIELNWFWDVGKSNNFIRRFGEHIKAALSGNWPGQSLLYNHMAKYGIDQFQITILEIILNGTPEFLMEREQYWKDQQAPAHSLNLIPAGVSPMLSKKSYPRIQRPHFSNQNSKRNWISLGPSQWNRNNRHKYINRWCNNPLIHESRCRFVGANISTLSYALAKGPLIFGKYKIQRRVNK